MDDEFDNILKNRIREVFDDFKDPSADEGWLLLRRKFPEEQAKRRAFAWLWWGSAAAILLLFLGIALLMTNSGRVNPEKLSGTKVKNSPPQRANLAFIEEHPGKRNKPVVNGKKEPLIIRTTNNRAIIANLPVDNKKNSSSVSGKGLPRVDTTTETGQIIETPVESDKIADNKAPDNPTIVASPSNLSTDHSNAPAKASATSIDAMFAKDNVAKIKSNEKEKSKKVHFGIYAATYFNYAKGSDNQVNLGGGITSDIKLGKHIKLVAGIAVGQNTLNYNANAPQAIQAIGDRLAASINLPASANNTAAATPPTAFKSYNASLVGLDIPVNLKYELNPQKNDTYISAGLSSGTFINESYTYHYNYPALPSVAQQGATTRTAFNTFYFAKTVDVAFGVGYPFGKNTRLVIEPFLKYPLQSLGSQQIRFGSGGLNLKLNFQSSKK